MDVTGRNIPPATSSTVWLFVDAINTHGLPPQWDTEYLRYAVRQERMIGFYHFEPGRVLPPPNANWLMRRLFRTRHDHP
jgi:hypothetical protein